MANRNISYLIVKKNQRPPDTEASDKKCCNYFGLFSYVPRYAAFTDSLTSSSAPVPLSVMLPVSMT